MKPCRRRSGRSDQDHVAHQHEPCEAVGQRVDRLAALGEAPEEETEEIE
jgi:hypothetical protein